METDGSMVPADDELITQWNMVDTPPAPRMPVRIHDETLRDGLQSPSVTQPTIEARLELLHLMTRLGVDSVDLGMPVSSPTAMRQVERLAQEIRDEALPLNPNCAARAIPADIAAVAEVAQRTGLPLSVMAFIGISSIRMYVEGWRLDSVLRDVQAAVAFARQEGLRVCIVTEDTTRSRLDAALDVYTRALDAGAERVCVCDTVGYSVPWGAAAVVSRIRRGLDQRGFDGVGIDWHGHNDRGLAVANSLAAAQAGADRLHGTALGIGERCGNAPLEQLLVNLVDLGWRTGDLGAVAEYCRVAARASGVGVPVNQPVIGADAFRTATGVHAAAVRKALARGDRYLADRVYSAVPASLLGRQQRIEVGPGSGRANVMYWLEQHDIEKTPEVVGSLVRAVSTATRVLTHRELHNLVDQARRSEIATIH